MHRCSRCGRAGHNVRRCPELHARGPWFRQRCGRCGGTGHNARNCAQSDDRCRVCRGAGRLACAVCQGLGRHRGERCDRCTGLGYLSCMACAD